MNPTMNNKSFVASLAATRLQAYVDRSDETGLGNIHEYTCWPAYGSRLDDKRGTIPSQLCRG